MARMTATQFLRRLEAGSKRPRNRLEQLVEVSDENLAKSAEVVDRVQKPYNADWVWRPEIWHRQLPTRKCSCFQSPTKIGNEVTLFHDCTHSEINLLQNRSEKDADGAAFHFGIDVSEFDGSFLSLVLDLPKRAVSGLNKTHIVAATLKMEVDEPLKVFARLNIRNGPNTEQIVRAVPAERTASEVAFDLGYAHFNENRIHKVWIDLIFECPRMNRIRLRDLTFCRRPRAPF